MNLEVIRDALVQGNLSIVYDYSKTLRIARIVRGKGFLLFRFGCFLDKEFVDEYELFSPYIIKSAHHDGYTVAFQKYFDDLNAIKKISDAHVNTEPLYRFLSADEPGDLTLEHLRCAIDVACNNLIDGDTIQMIPPEWVSPPTTLCISTLDDLLTEVINLSGRRDVRASYDIHRDKGDYGIRIYSTKGDIDIHAHGKTGKDAFNALKDLCSKEFKGSFNRF